MIISEGGINWCWFTEIIVEDNGVTIVRHWREHREGWKTFPKDAIQHPGYWHTSIWKEGEGRIALEYFVPGIGWKTILNPQFIFSYQ